MKFKMEEISDLVFGVEKEPIFSIELDTITTHLLNQMAICAWKKSDYSVLKAIWNCVKNIIFFHIRAYQTTNKAWLTLETHF